MPSYLTITLNSKQAERLVSEGDGPVLIFNDDPNNSIFLGDNWGIRAGGTDTIPLAPLGSVVVNGDYNVWATTATGQTATVYVVPGGLNFFQLVEIVTKAIVVNSGGIPPGGLFVYNGIGALGNPPIMAIVAPGVTTDPYGNTVQSLANFGTFPGAHFGIDTNGQLLIADVNNVKRIFLGNNPVSIITFDPTGQFPVNYIDPVNDAIWQYGASVPVNNAVVVHHTQFTSTSTAANQTFTLPWTPTPGNTLIVCSRTTENVTSNAMKITAIATNSNPDNWRQDRSDGVSGTDNFINQTWSDPGLTVADPHINITFNNAGASSPSNRIQIMEVSGLLLPTPLDGVGAGHINNINVGAFSTGAAGPSSTALSMAVANIGVASGSVSTITGVGAWTVIENNSNTLMATQLLSAIGSVTCSGTMVPNSVYTAQVVIYKVLGSTTQGSLSIALAAMAATDPVTGQNVVKGLTIFGNTVGVSPERIQLTNSAGVLLAQFLTGTATEVSPGNIKSGAVFIGGASEQQEFIIGAPVNSASNDGVFISLNSSPANAPNQSQGNLDYQLSGGGFINLLNWGIRGVGAQAPGGWSGGVAFTKLDQFTRATGNTTTHTQITQSPTVNPNDWDVNGTTWELEAWGNLTTGAAITQVGFEFAAMGVTLCARGITLFLANTTYDWSIVVKLLSGAGAAVTAQATMRYSIAQAGVSATGSNTLSGAVYDNAIINTTIAHTFQLNSWWSGLSAGQNVQCVASVARRQRDA